MGSTTTQARRRRLGKPAGQESDNRDEAICAYDGNILDDEIREIIRKFSMDARLTIISDSCHSGTVTRLRLQNEAEASLGDSNIQLMPKPRYMPPENEMDAFRTMLLPIRRRVFYPESGMKEILLTGCNALELSYDAYINGRFNGAMTATAISLIKSNLDMTYQELHRKLRQLLPTTRFPQSPQLEGSSFNKNRPLFG